MIPKVIHYCWLSGEKMPVHIRECIRSWKRVLPDYKLRLWTMADFDVNKIPYVAEAIQHKKWAFACDYIRLYALYHEGGIYLDSDVYVKKKLDFCLNNRFFSAIESYPVRVEQLIANGVIDRKGTILDNSEPIEGLQLQAAILGSEKGHPFVKDLLDFYEHNSFLHADGTPNIQLIAPIIYANIAQKYGFKYLDEEQRLSEGIHIYSRQMFPPTMDATLETSVAVHCCANSWKVKNRSTTYLKISNIIKEILFQLHLPSNHYLDSVRKFWSIS